MRFANVVWKIVILIYIALCSVNLSWAAWIGTTRNSFAIMLIISLFCVSSVMPFLLSARKVGMYFVSLMAIIQSVYILLDVYCNYKEYVIVKNLVEVMVWSVVYVVVSCFIFYVSYRSFTGLGSFRVEYTDFVASCYAVVWCFVVYFFDIKYSHFFIMFLPLTVIAGFAFVLFRKRKLL